LKRAESGLRIGAGEKDRDGAQRGSRKPSLGGRGRLLPGGAGGLPHRGEQHRCLATTIVGASGFVDPRILVEVEAPAVVEDP
jgi:hypothetical protein